MNMCVELNIKERILQRIEESAAHSVFFIGDFTDIGAAETVRKVLREATEKGMLEHLAHGIYVRPMMSRFGSVPMPLEHVAMEIAKRDNVQILPTGETAANVLGVSTQIPMSVSFITTGSSRVINVGCRKICFTHAAPRNFAYEGTTIPLIVQAFRALGEGNIGETELSAIARYVEKASDKKQLMSDLRFAPQWVQSKVKPIVGRVV